MNKCVIVKLFGLSTVLLLLLMPPTFLQEAFCANSALHNARQSMSEGQKDQQHKQETLRQVALNWIDVGVEQFKRGLYEQAEQSFLEADRYQEYLSKAEHKDLENHLNKTRSAIIERKTILENIQQAKTLIEKGQPVEARAAYEKIRKSPYLTDTQRRQIADELKKIDSAFDRQRKELTALYERSIELYRAGNLEKAREGFAEVAKSDLLVTPKGQSPQDYLLQIDNILTAKAKPQISEKSVSEQQFSKEEKIATSGTPESIKNSQDTEYSDINEMDLLNIAGDEDNELLNQKPRKETTGSIAVDQSLQEDEEPNLLQTKDASRKKIIRTYTSAVVESAEKKVQMYIENGEYEKAITVIHNTADIIRENRPIIGDELFVKYSSRLKSLADKIIEATKKI